MVEAFNRVTEHSMEWPSPALFLSLIPELPVKREYFKALPKQELTPEQERAERERRERIVAAQWEALGWKRKHEDA